MSPLQNFWPVSWRYQGTFRTIINPSTTSYRHQISALTDRLQSKCNSLWKRICPNRSLIEKKEKAFLTTNSKLPTMYILLKIHKFAVEDIQSPADIINKCKVRPIISYCSSPTGKLAWLCTYILSPLLDTIPCHLKTIYDQ